MTVFNYCKGVALSVAVISLASCMDAKENAQDSRFLLCKNDGPESDVIMEFGTRRFSGYDLNCISGDFVVDMSGCAPEGAYGLHSSTGSAGLEKIVTRWQDYANHFGGVVSHYITATEISFSGGFTFPSSGYAESWNFTVNRLTGKGQSRTKDGAIQYSCRFKNQAF